jgi:hypothetical protein
MKPSLLICPISSDPVLVDAQEPQQMCKAPQQILEIVQLGALDAAGVGCVVVDRCGCCLVCNYISIGCRPGGPSFMTCP